jgi:hypothetical protein
LRRINDEEHTYGQSHVIQDVWTHVDFEKERVRAYERAYLHEKALRIKTVDALRKHEERLFGEVQPISSGYYGSMKGFIPTTPPEETRRPKSPDDGTLRPRTPDVKDQGQRTPMTRDVKEAYTHEEDSVLKTEKERISKMTWKEASEEDKKFFKPIVEARKRELELMNQEWDKKRSNSSSSSGGEKIKEVEVEFKPRINMIRLMNGKFDPEDEEEVEDPEAPKTPTPRTPEEEDPTPQNNENEVVFENT